MRLGEYLVQQGVLQSDRLERTLKIQQDNPERLGVLLVSLGLVSEKDVASGLAEQLGLTLADISMYSHTAVLNGSVSQRYLRESQIAPLHIEDDVLHVAMAVPQDSYAIDALKMASGFQLQIYLGTASDIELALNRQYGEEDASDQNQTNYLSQDNIDDIQHLRDLASEAPVVRLVNGFFSRALEVMASDIHIEPFEERLSVRFRVDGQLREVDTPAKSMAAAITSRIKIMANLDIAERRLPQDGRLSHRIEGKMIDMRVSTVPTSYGESVVLRILDKTALPLEFDALGFEGTLLTDFQKMLDLPHGVILVTGPTGSGKTTTLYAALQSLNSPERKILTVEDPVEYQLEGINQIQVKPQIDLTFANALRSILRQDPDVIMIGEMRDPETAKIAVQSALTGHKVFSTLHTNSAASSITRLLDMGVENYLLTSTINGVLAQRLARKLCPVCREPYHPQQQLLAETGLDGLVSQNDTTIYRPAGCPSCNDTGYQARTALLELFTMNESLRQAILEHVDATKLQSIAEQQGMHTMHRDGLEKVIAGVTSLEEISRVTQEV